MTSDRDAYDVLQVLPSAHQQVIRAAYRALAALYHPDRSGSRGSIGRMVELNAAYEAVRTTDRRAVYDRARQRRSAATPSYAAGNVARQTPAPDALDFGRYAGWTIREIARHDPDYLRWLSRHSSGLRHRQRIHSALTETVPLARNAEPARRR